MSVPSADHGAAPGRRAGDTSESGTPPAAGLDLHIELAGPRVRAALEAALREGVQTGRLAGGMRLPATRTLAADLGIARNTVADAYGQLVAEGWLTARQGSGTHVAEHAAARSVPPATAGTRAAATAERAAAPVTPVLGPSGAAQQLSAAVSGTRGESADGDRRARRHRDGGSRAG